MSNELAVTEERALAQLADLDLTPPGFDEHVLPEDVAQPPRLRLMQQTHDKIETGGLYNSLTEKRYGSAVEVVFLKFENDTRCLWPASYRADNDPECYSNDAINPATPTPQRPMTNPQKGPCETCPFAKWGENREPPRCKRQRNFLLWLVEDNEPIRLTVQSTSMSPAKTLTNLAVSCNVRKSIVVTSHFQKDERGEWYVYLYTTGNKLPPQLSLDLYNLRNELIDLDVLADVTASNGESTAEAKESPRDVPF